MPSAAEPSAAEPSAAEAESEFHTLEEMLAHGLPREAAFDLFDQGWAAEVEDIIADVRRKTSQASQQERLLQVFFDELDAQQELPEVDQSVGINFVLSIEPTGFWRSFVFLRARCVERVSSFASSCAKGRPAGAQRVLATCRQSILCSPCAPVPGLSRTVRLPSLAFVAHGPRSPFRCAQEERPFTLVRLSHAMFWLLVRASAAAECVSLARQVAELTTENALLRAQAGLAPPGAPDVCLEAAKVLEGCAARELASGSEKRESVQAWSESTFGLATNGAKDNELPLAFREPDPRAGRDAVDDGRAPPPGLEASASNVREGALRGERVSVGVSPFDGLPRLPVRIPLPQGQG